MLRVVDFSLGSKSLQIMPRPNHAFQDLQDPSCILIDGTLTELSQPIYDYQSPSDPW